MDVLIKGMKIPKSCEECWMTYEGDSDNCPVVNESVVKYMVEEKKHPACPLVEVPPHGDLIERSSVYKVLDDRIAFYKEAGDDYNACNIACVEGDIVAIPTIIEASN